MVRAPAVRGRRRQPGSSCTTNFTGGQLTYKILWLPTVKTSDWQSETKASRQATHHALLYAVVQLCIAPGRVSSSFLRRPRRASKKFVYCRPEDNFVIIRTRKFSSWQHHSHPVENKFVLTALFLSGRDFKKSNLPFRASVVFALHGRQVLGGG
jgi:hypothetical protein